MNEGGDVAVTVAVCTRDRADRIGATLGSVLANRFPSMEVLVVDQSDDDRTRQAVAALGDERLRHVSMDERGIGPSRFLAVEAARGEIVAFTDDDCTVPEDWVEVMVDRLRAHADVGMAFCTVRAAPHDPSAGFVPTYDRPGEQVARTVGDKNRARGIGAGMAVRRSTARSIGSFDVSVGSVFPRLGNEEGDLALRMLLAGHGLLETDRTWVVHDGFRRWDQGRDLTRRNFTGIGLTYAKPIRARRWEALRVVLHEGVVVPALGSLRELRRRHRPPVGAFVHFWRGFARGLGQPVDPATLTFRAGDRVRRGIEIGMRAPDEDER